MKKIYEIRDNLRGHGIEVEDRILERGTLLMRSVPSLIGLKRECAKHDLDVLVFHHTDYYGNNCGIQHVEVREKTPNLVNNSDKFVKIMSCD